MPPGNRPLRLALIIALAVLLGGAALALLTGRTVAMGPSRLQLVVEPHPDDLLEAAAALQDDPSMFTLFITMTFGEQTEHCATPTAEVRYGELAPRPYPTGRGSATCRSARLHSWTSFLTAAANTLPGVPSLPHRQQVLRLGPEAIAPSAAVGQALLAPGIADTEGALITVDTRAAAVAFDAGDGDVTVGEVRRAIQVALSLRGSWVPDLPLDQLIAAAYWNDSPQHGTHTTATGCSRQICPGSPDALEYEHPDHRAVQLGVAQLAPMATRGALLVTHPFDPRATDTLRIPLGRYHALLGLGPQMDATAESFRRVGMAQVHYGWLAFPRSYWVPGELAAAGSDVLFPRIQYFRRIS